MEISLGEGPKFDVRRISIGRAMFNKSCILSIHSGGRNQHLRLMYRKENKQDIEHMIQIDDVNYINYHIDIDVNPDEKLESSNSCLPNILIFQIIPNVGNKLVMYPNQYKPDENKFNKKYTIVEFASSDKLMQLLDLLKKIEGFKKLLEDGGLTVEERRHFISLFSTGGNSHAGKKARSLDDEVSRRRHIDEISTTPKNGNSSIKERPEKKRNTSSSGNSDMDIDDNKYDSAENKSAIHHQRRNMEKRLEVSTNMKASVRILTPKIIDIDAIEKQKVVTVSNTDNHNTANLKSSENSDIDDEFVSLSGIQVSTTMEKSIPRSNDTSSSKLPLTSNMLNIGPNQQHAKAIDTSRQWTKEEVSGKCFELSWDSF
jgi:hypothetical protein